MSDKNIEGPDQTPRITHYARRLVRTYGIFLP